MLQKQIKNVVLPTISEMVHMKDGTTVLSDLIIPCNKNLFNKDTIHLKQLPSSSTGELGYNALAYGCSDFIKVEAGVTYACNKLGNVFEYRVDKSFKQLRSINAATYTVPDDVGYIILQIASETINPTPESNIMFVKGSELPDEYYPYYSYTINRNIFKEVGNGGGGSTTSSPLTGQTIDFVGDSMTVRGTWQSYLKTNYDVIAKEYCANGAPMSGNTGIVNKYLKQADTSADAIVIVGGTNDVHYNCQSGTNPLGKIGDTTIDTFCGSIDVMCKYLLSNFKCKRILICSSPRRFDTINGIDVNIPLDKYIKAEKQIIENYGLPFLDFFHEYAHYMTSGDKIHANGESYDLFGRVIARKLESM